MGMGKPKRDTSSIDQLALFLNKSKSEWKHKTAVVTLIQRFSDIEKARRPIYCLENMAIDEVQTELWESIRVLLNDK